MHQPASSLYVITYDFGIIDRSQYLIILVVIGATRLVKNNLKDYLQAMIGHPNPEEVQLAAIK